MLWQDDVQSLRSDLSGADLNGLGGSLQRALAVQCALHGETVEALRFASDALDKDKNCCDTLMLVSYLKYLLGEFADCCEYCIRVLDLGKTTWIVQNMTFVLCSSAVLRCCSCLL